ncbi:hypothetical protein P3S68_012327 [Capsicum galapagoense]
MVHTFKLEVEYSKTYLLRMINSAMNEILFFAVAEHKLTVVRTDGSYTKPLTRDFITISPGLTYDCILEANQKPDRSSLMVRDYQRNFPWFPLSTIRIQLHCPYPIYASGVWFLHCHFERHLTWGMNTVFIVREGKHREEQLLPRPSDMPPC